MVKQLSLDCVLKRSRQISSSKGKGEGTRRVVQTFALVKVLVARKLLLELLEDLAGITCLQDMQSDIIVIFGVWCELHMHTMFS